MAQHKPLVHADIEQYSEKYWKLRNGLPTASCAKLLVTSTGLPSKSLSGYATALANDLYAGKRMDEWEGNKYTERGSELEAIARAEYMMAKQVEVTEVGFVTDYLIKYGASPDAMIGKDGLLEIKCLISTNHTKALLYYKANDKPPPEYIAQTQMQMMVTMRKWCDLVFYHPDLPMIIIRCTPVKAVVTTLQVQLKAVIAERNLVLKTLKKYNSTGGF